jgi:hypothetical protein
MHYNGARTKKLVHQHSILQIAGVLVHGAPFLFLNKKQL